MMSHNLYGTLKPEVKTSNSYQRRSCLLLSHGNKMIQEVLKPEELIFTFILGARQSQLSRMHLIHFILQKQLSILSLIFFPD